MDAGVLDYTRIGNAELFLGDCRKAMFYPDAIDAVITDNPYGIDNQPNNVTRKRNNWVRGKEFRPIEGDDEPFDPAMWLGFDKVVLFGANHFCSRLPDASCWLIWDKREGTTPDNQSDCELIWTNLPGPNRIYQHLWRGICRRGEENIRNGAHKLHPNQKPVGLMLWIMQQCKLKANSIILDPYMGSGTTGVAAIRLGHQFIGVDKDPEHYETACRRLEEEQRQMRLCDHRKPAPTQGALLT